MHSLFYFINLNFIKMCYLWLSESWLLTIGVKITIQFEVLCWYMNLMNTSLWSLVLVKNHKKAGLIANRSRTDRKSIITISCFEDTLPKTWVTLKSDKNVAVSPQTVTWVLYEYDFKYIQKVIGKIWCLWFVWLMNYFLFESL